MRWRLAGGGRCETEAHKPPQTSHAPELGSPGEKKPQDSAGMLSWETKGERNELTATGRYGLIANRRCAMSR